MITRGRDRTTVEDQRPQWRVGVALRRRDFGDHGFENLVNPRPCLALARTARSVQADDLLNLFAIRSGSARADRSC